MGTHWRAAAGILAAFLLLGARKAQAEIRTDRLSGKALETWRSIVAIVMAVNSTGGPRHPTLRRLWDTVETSGHAVYIDLPDSKTRRSYIAGRFAITKIDPEGRAHEAILIMNLRAIEHTSTDSGAARAGGFIPFKGLSKRDRYAELLGHELAHAVWHLADPERAYVAERLQAETEARMHLLLVAGPGSAGVELQAEVNALDRLGRELEEPAEAAEMTIWKELVAGHRER